MPAIYVRGARSNVTDEAGLYPEPVECEFCPDPHRPDEDCPTWAVEEDTDGPD